MASDSLHAPRERLSKDTLHMHHAIVSLIEEMEAVNWYRQRADDCDDEEFLGITAKASKPEYCPLWIKRYRPIDCWR